MKRTPLFLLAAAMLCVPAPAPAQLRPIGDTQVFARIGEPGMPEGIAVGGGVVYVGTHTSVLGNAGGPPSKIFKFNVNNRMSLGEITITGQDLSVTHGILGMHFGPDGALYVVDQNPGRILRIDTSMSDEQTTYATIPDLPSCPLTGPTPGGCSPTLFAQPTWANDFAFAPDGSMYVTDLQAATIFRVPAVVGPVPAGGVQAQIWYQDERFDSYFGVNGIAIDPAGTKLYLAMTFSLQPTSPTQGIIYTLPVQPDSPKQSASVFHTFDPGAGPDGLAFGASGKLYVPLAGSNQLAILSADGLHATIFPDPVTNLITNLAPDEIPYDAPASVAFDGKGSALITNHPFFTGNSSHWAVLDVWVGDMAP